jgi:hypothetical protein
VAEVGGNPCGATVTIRTAAADGVARTIGITPNDSSIDRFARVPPVTPTTKILAVGTFAPGTDMSQVQRILPTEVRETAQLYLDGKIDQWYSLEDPPGVVFILNMTDTLAAHAMLEELPLGKAHLMTFQLTPIGPLNPLRQLLIPAVPH